MMDWTEGLTLFASAQGNFPDVPALHQLVHSPSAVHQPQTGRTRRRRRCGAVRQAGGDEDWLEAAADEEPGPEEAVILMDQIQALLQGLPDLHCRVLDLRLSGHSVADIADQLHIARQTVYPAMNLLQQRLQANL